MNENVIKFEPVVVGEAYRFDPDEALEAAKDLNLTSVTIIGAMPNGETWFSSSVGAGETLLLLKRAELILIDGRS
jgi:hypothetical protein